MLRDPAGNALDGVTAAIRTPKPLREKFWSASLRSTDLVARTPEGPRQMLEAQLVSGGLTDVTCRMAFPGKVPPLVLSVGDLPLGEHRVELLVPVLENGSPVRVTFAAASDELVLDSVPLAPPRAWTDGATAAAAPSCRRDGVWVVLVAVEIDAAPRAGRHARVGRARPLVSAL